MTKITNKNGAYATIRFNTKKARYQIGEEVKTNYIGQGAYGTIERVYEWDAADPNGYHGFVYDFRNAVGQIFTGWKEELIEPMTAN